MSMFYALQIKRGTSSGPAADWIATDDKDDEIIVNKDINIMRFAKEKVVDIIVREMSLHKDGNFVVKDIERVGSTTNNTTGKLYKVYFYRTDDLIHPAVIYTISLVKVRLGNTTK